MKNRSILIFGASGYIGSSAALFFKQKGFDVIAVFRKEPKDFSLLTGVKGIVADVNDDSILNIINEINVDYVLYTISLDNINSENSDLRILNETSVFSAWKIANIFSKKNIKKFIYISTFHSIGECGLKNIDENIKKRPKTFYGLTHSLVEEIISYYNKGEVKFVNIRLSNGYGSPSIPNNNCWNLVVNNLVKSAIEKNKIILKSNGLAQRDFIHVNDINIAISTLLNSELKEDLFNVCSGKTYSLLEVAHLVKKVFQQKFNNQIKVYYSENIESINAPETKIEFQLENNTLLKYGFSLGISLEDGIIELFNHLECIKKK